MNPGGNLASDATPADRAARVKAIADRIRSHADSMAELLADAQDSGKLFGHVEFKLRDAAHRLAADAHQTALDHPSPKKLRRQA